MQKITLTMTVDVADDAVEKLVNAFVAKASPVVNNEAHTTPVNVAEVRATETPDSMTPVPETSDLDDFGVPYNKKVHAATKTKNADGSWKAFRGKADEAKSWAAQHQGADTATGEIVDEPRIDDEPMEIPAHLKRDPVTNEPAMTLPTSGGLPGAATIPPVEEKPEPVTLPALMEVFNQFIAKHGDETGKAKVQELYKTLNIDAAMINSNETDRSKLKAAMEADITA